MPCQDPRPTHSIRPSPTSPASPNRPGSTRTTRRLIAITSLGLAGLLAGLLAGCAATAPQAASQNPSQNPSQSPSTVSYAQLAGNWQFSSTYPAAVRLSSIGGSLSVSGSTVIGTLHPLHASGQCLLPATVINASGSIDSAGLLTLTAPLSSGTLTLSGTVAPDRQSLSGATYTVSGGSCAIPADIQVASPRGAYPIVTAQQYQPLSGTYTGTLTDEDGVHFTLTTTITQTSQPDADGLYHLQGSASSPGNACIPPSVTATASSVNGSAVLTTFTDAATSTTIDSSGSSSPDASTLTISSWSLSSNCGSDSGTGTLIRQ